MSYSDITTSKRYRNEIETGTYTDEDGCLRWNMGNAVPPWVWEDAYGEPMGPEMAAAYARDLDAFLAEYRSCDEPPDDEQLFEMRAAFGPGETVVNVLTGRRTKL